MTEGLCQNQRDRFYDWRRDAYEIGNNVFEKADSGEMLTGAFYELVEELINGNVSSIEGETYTIEYNDESNILYLRSKNTHRTPLNINLNSCEIALYGVSAISIEEVDMLYELYEQGLIDTLSLPFLGNVERFRENANVMQDLIDSHSTDDVGELSSTSDMNDDKFNVIPVLQGEAIIISDPREYDSLYTFGAGPCVIVMYYDSSSHSIGMAHVDGVKSKDAIRSFLPGNEDESLELYLIGGDNDINALIFDVLRERNLYDSIRFFDVENGRTDAAGIVRNGNAVELKYGNNDRLNQSIPAEQIPAMFMSTMASPLLQIERLDHGDE